MNRNEATRLVGVASANYRNWPEKDKVEAVIELWCSMFEDVDYHTAVIALKKYMLESQFPPTVADIRARIVDITTTPSLQPMEAWGEVKHAIRRYGYMRETEALESMSESTRQVVRNIGFQTLCMSDNEMADRAHFLKVFETQEKRRREDAMLSPMFKTAIENKRQEGELKRLGGGD